MTSKKLIFGLIGCALLLTLAGCSNLQMVRGSGDVKEYTVSLDAYTSVKVEGAFAIVYRADVSEDIVIETYENLYEHISVEVTDGTLLITSRKTLVSSGNRPAVTVYIAPETLEQLSLDGAVSVESDDVMRGDALHIAINGAGSIDAEVDYETLSISIHGAGSADLWGRVENASFHINGVGEVSALDLKVSHASGSINGVGSLSLYCTETLSAEIAGLGSIEYRGNPAVTKDISGGGDLVHLDD